MALLLESSFSISSFTDPIADTIEAINLTRSEFLTQSTFDTISLFLAVVAGIWEDASVQNYPLLLFSIQGALTAGTLFVLYVLSIVSKSMARRFLNLVLKGLIWIVAVLAGSLFSYGYSLAIANWLIGVPLLVGYMFLVIGVTRWIRSIQHIMDQKERSMFKA